MLKLGGLLLNILGIGKQALENRAALKQAKFEGKQRILEAQTKADVKSVEENNASDNSIDLITVKNQDKTWKDEIITYLFLIPVLNATIVPFIIANKTGQWENLNALTLASYKSLDSMPDWYIYVLFAIIIAALGFRSFARKGLSLLLDKLKK